MILGAIIGLILGYLLATKIFPPGILSIRLLELTIGDLLRIIGGLLVILMGLITGGVFGSMFKKKG
jgi:hypothetical protein